MMREPVPIDAEWVRGYRLHGLFHRGKQVITLDGGVPVTYFGYEWSLDWPEEGTACGCADTLRRAKRAATRVWNEVYLEVT